MQEEIKQNIVKYLEKKTGLDMNKVHVNILLEREDGLNNYNYHVRLTYLDVDRAEVDLFYKKYGEISQSIGHHIERQIVELFSQKRICPFAYVNEDTYRIEEYLTDLKTVPLVPKPDPVIVENTFKILCEYSLLANICHYNINETTHDVRMNSITEGRPVEVDKNFYQISLESMLPQAQTKFEEFSHSFHEYYDKNDPKNEELYKDFDLLENFVKNYTKIFTEAFPQEGFFILAHNDLHGFNILVKDEQKNIFIIDNEYACYNLIGLDVANYFNENSYHFTDGGYFFEEEAIDADYYFENYLKFIDLFIKANEDWCVKTSEGQEYMRKISSKKYYCNLHVITNLFWTVYCIIALDFDKEFIDHKLFSFRYGCDRLKYARKMKEIGNNSSL